jgi:H+-transporting ATPase
MEMIATAGSSTGLTSAEAARRLAEFGPNAVVERAPPAWRMFLAKFWTPVAWMLEAAAVLQIGLGQPVEAGVIAGLLACNACLGFLQESRATAALAALKRQLAPSALVCRTGKWVRRPAAELVPGDAIRLFLGSVVPADARILEGSVMIDQSMLTGESVPIDVEAGASVYAGALVRRGQALAEVTATGAKTYFGRTAELVRLAHGASSEQAAILGAVRNLAVVNGAITLGIVVYAHAVALPTTDLIRLALTALLASIPVALPATFTLSAAISALALARKGVLLTRVSAVHEAAAMDILCSDKTGTLTLNALDIDRILPMQGFGQDRVLAFAALASSDADQDPIDAAVRKAAANAGIRFAARLLRFVPFDPISKTAEALVASPDDSELRIIKGAFQAVVGMAETPVDARRLVDDLAGQGHRVIAVAVGPPKALRLAGLIALSDPPREDSASLVAALRTMGVRTVMITGDSATTATAIARKVGIPDSVCPPEQLPDELSGEQFGVFARILPEQKYRLVKALQRHGHVVGMCGDGANDAPALRQAQIGIAVSSATDVAKAAAALVLTEPGLGGIVSAVREGRIAFQRILTYTFNMMVKKIEIVLFLAVGLGLTGRAVMTPVLMVLLLVTNDFLSMSLTTDRATPASSPSGWRMPRVTAAAVMLAACKLSFSTAILAIGAFSLRLETAELQALAFVTLVFGNQAVLYAVRERRRMWASRPSLWVLASSCVDIGIVTVLALTGLLMQALPWQLLLVVFAAAAGFSLVLDQVKLLVTAALEWHRQERLD